MRIAKERIPVQLEVPGAIARQRPDFGAPSGTLGAEYFSFAAGTDLAPTFVGLPGNACQVEHWGYVVTGHAVVTYDVASEEHCRTGDVFHWPGGHTIRFEQDTDLVMFSPQAEHSRVLRHVQGILTDA